jgi:hypothetical protein
MTHAVHIQYRRTNEADPVNLASQKRLVTLDRPAKTKFPLSYGGYTWDNIQWLKDPDEYPSDPEQGQKGWITLVSQVWPNQRSEANLIQIRTVSVYTASARVKNILTLHAPTAYFGFGTFLTCAGGYES